MTDIETIHERNQRVEAEKAWETSRTRRLCIAAITYCIATAYMTYLGVSSSHLQALIPTGGYLLSTLGLGVIKQHWMKSYKA